MSWCLFPPRGSVDPLGGVEPWFLILAGVVAGGAAGGRRHVAVCALVLWMYRRRIDRGMRGVARPVLADAPSMPPEDGDNRRIAVREVELRGQLSLLERARRRARRSQLLFALLGLGYGLAATAAYHIVDEAQWRPVRVAAYTLLLGWPVLPTLLALSTARRRIWWLSWGVYVAAVATLLVVAGESMTEILTMAIPMLFVLATSAHCEERPGWLLPGSWCLALRWSLGGRSWSTCATGRPSTGLRGPCWPSGSVCRSSLSRMAGRSLASIRRNGRVTRPC